MAKDERRTNTRLGPLFLGPCHDELGPGLGRLYEAWQEDTGEPVLLLRPDPQVDWSPAGPLKLQVFFNPDVSAVTVKVEEASAPPDLSDVANLLVMTTASVTRVEDDPQVRAHVASRPRPGGRTPLPPLAHRPRLGLALAGLAALVLGVWLCLGREPSDPEIVWAYRTAETPGEGPAWILGSSEDLGAGSISYPMPSKPFSNQAISPCYPQIDEVEINGGCWFEVARRPPCLKDVQAEHEGKCYLPISKDRRKKPAQSVQP
jgi:hypothetical protein